MFQLGFGFTPFQSGPADAFDRSRRDDDEDARLADPAPLRLSARDGRQCGRSPPRSSRRRRCFYAGMPVAVIAATLLVAGFVRSLQFTSINVSALSDVPDA